MDHEKHEEQKRLGGLTARQDKPLNPADPNFEELRSKRLREMGARCLNGDGVTGIGIMGGVPPNREEHTPTSSTTLNPDDPNFEELRLKRLHELGGKLGTDLSGAGIVGGKMPNSEEEK